MPDRAGEHRVVGQTLGCALDLVERFGRAPPFLFQNAEYFRSQCLIGNKFGVPLGKAHVGFGQHHVHIGQQARGRTAIRGSCGSADPCARREPP